MAIIRHPRKEFEKHLKLTEKTLEDLSLFGTPAEFTSGKSEIEIEINPNRPDLIPMQNLIRNFKTFQGHKPGLKKYIIHKPGKNYRVKIDKSVKAVRPYTSCAILKNLNLDDEKIKEIINIQEKIHNTLGRNRKKVAIGIYPLEKIKLPIKYEAKKPGDIKFIPLESTREMNAPQILRRHPKGKEYSDLLKPYSVYPLFTDGTGKILSMPPIINSNETGKISTSTKEAFIECSGSDRELLDKTLNILVSYFAEINAKIYGMEIEDTKKYISPNLDPEEIKVSRENTNKLLGLNLSEKDIGILLGKMGYDYKNKTAYIPAWRTDILHEVDIIEDIAIAFGYDKFLPVIPETPNIGQEDRESKLKRKISEILIGLNLLETSTLHLIKKDEAKRMRTPPQSVLEMEDSKTEYKVLRPNLLIPTLRVLSENKDVEYPQNLFEIGKVFSKTSGGLKEPTNLLLAFSHSKTNFTEAKQALDYLFRMLDLSYETQKADAPGLIPGRTAKIFLSGTKKEIGHLGEVHPQTLNSWNLKMPVTIIELDLSEVLKELI